LLKLLIEKLGNTQFNLKHVIPITHYLSNMTEEEVLKCACGGNIFHMLRIDDIQEIECPGCRRRVWLRIGKEIPQD
jgi:hypothetical protein